MNIDQISCPIPPTDHGHILLAHGAGGKLSAELVERIFLPEFQNAALSTLADAAVLPRPSGRLAFSTDSYVVRPLFFPGGSIGDLAVHGTINDLAMLGAHPLALSAGFILEEGFPLETLRRVVQDMAAASRSAGVPIVTGDTKVVDRGHGDGCYINTAGIGALPDHLDLGPSQIREGDAVLLSGTIADHGLAILSARENLQFDAPIESDSAPLHHLVQSMLSSTNHLHMLRDPTRGGIATTLIEIATAAKLGIMLMEESVPMNPATRSACELLGLDPFTIANEGKLLAIVAPSDADALLNTMQRHPLATRAQVIGHVTANHPGTVVVQTALGGRRVLSPLIGEPLPRIC